VIAIWATRRTRTSRDFYVAGQGIGLWGLGIAAMASTVSGFAFIGGPGLMYSTGLAALYIVLPAAVTSTLSAWVLGKRLRVLAEVRGVMTVPEAIGVRYRSRAARGLASIALLVAVAGYMATNLLALGLVIDAIFATGRTSGIWIGMILVMSYSVSGGIFAGIYTDLFQGLVMAIASTLVFLFALGSGGGLENLTRQIVTNDPGFLSPWGTLTPLAALSFYFVFGVGTLGQPHVIHKYFMLRDPRRLKWYPLLMTSALILTLLLFFGVGIAVKAAVARGELPPLQSPDDATPAFLLQYTPVLLAGVVFSGVAAAVMSTVNSFMNIGAAAVTHDLPSALGRPPLGRLSQGRLATVALSIGAAILAQSSGQLVALLGVFGWGLFASTLVPALAIGLNWPGATRAGAIASIASGLILTLGFESLAWFGLYRFPAGVTVAGLSLVVSLLVFVVVSWLTSSQAARDLDDDIRLVMEV
jgi:Na+/proline symporter